MVNKAIAILDLVILAIAFFNGLTGATGLAIAGVALYLSTPAIHSVAKAFKDETDISK